MSSTCPNPELHGNPFRYCSCGWMENPTAAPARPARHPSTEHLLSLFEWRHLPPHLQAVSLEFAALAENSVKELEDGPELTAGLRKLLEAKDCFVRQAVIDDRNRGNSQ